MHFSLTPVQVTSRPRRTGNATRKARRRSRANTRELASNQRKSHEERFGCISLLPRTLERNPPAKHRRGGRSTFVTPNKPDRIRFAVQQEVLLRYYVQRLAAKARERRSAAVSRPTQPSISVRKTKGRWRPCGPRSAQSKRSRHDNPRILARNRLLNWRRLCFGAKASPVYVEFPSLLA